MWLNPQFPADLITFTEEILNGKLDFLCSAYSFQGFPQVLRIWGRTSNAVKKYLWRSSFDSKVDGYKPATLQMY